MELDPPRRLVFTWGWEPGGAGTVPVGASTVEIELVPRGDGTKLRFAHRGLPSAEAAQSHAHGWDHYLERLAVVARGDDPGPDKPGELGRWAEPLGNSRYFVPYEVVKKCPAPDSESHLRRDL